MRQDRMLSDFLSSRFTFLQQQAEEDGEEHEATANKIERLF